LAADLVERKVDVIAATGGGPAALAAKGATTIIPIVFIVGSDPVGSGLVASLARPGGNLTGVTVLARELVPKQIELLSDLVPQTRVMGLLLNPASPAVTWREQMPRDIEEVANAKGIELHRLTASTENELDAAFATLIQMKAGAVLVAADPFFYLRREQIATLAMRHSVPAIYESRAFAEVGGLISYGRITTGAMFALGRDLRRADTCRCQTRRFTRPAAD
jgi:putative tryptophan/tyrosine transport system substrate-binding protein